MNYSKVDSNKQPSMPWCFNYMKSRKRNPINVLMLIAVIASGNILLLEYAHVVNADTRTVLLPVFIASCFIMVVMLLAWLVVIFFRKHDK